MRKLLNTAYITSPDSYLSLDGENLVVQKVDTEAVRLPLHNLESIIAFGYTGASPALMGACAKRNISLSFMTQSGKFLSRIVGEVRGNVTLRKTQYRLSDNLEESTRIARNFIFGKIYNGRWVIERATRDYSERLDVIKLKRVSEGLAKALNLVLNCENLDELRGYEGESATQYFSVFDDLILQQKDNFFFHGRNKRPPLDNVNAMLSFVYTLLAHDTSAALETVGLDPYVGFMHRDRPGRISLALDLMEELRCVYADRFVISLINKRVVNFNGFTQKEDGAVIMDDDTRKTILQAWQNRKQEKITHPFLQEKLEWGLVPYAQAMLLARFIRGDLDEYPPFLWK
ncbi:CRISPR-associated protein Cas1 [Ruminiclostridium papyrosolvens DSM 2782]|uniref:CRISPR-associated endonuclease Cas1 n=1 Tax=Ruminiclostridium papyrosolvens DSM 2782 TaxID=588581 RepID=F1T9R3_9FIRM|nr:type I-C CRISPR-associated endonuclease Cas1c [Ruminiclostridium papyrosolvens]EGD49245.1 CRISPR-associated protein Cas1 [Ruminiclostridium papyrosolvens DSM 2782]WES35720.1 type I-C CRISPR-associated endonuclease Cas1c [Ruminiclostridium papyrosolvens DSM 2782]